MKRSFNLSELSWTVAGFVPYEWELSRSLETGVCASAEIYPVPVQVPGSVQLALHNAGIIPDWNIGLDERQCEWVENRHWIFETALPDEWVPVETQSIRLNCRGLDYCGCIRLNGAIIYSFANAHLPHEIDLTPHLAPSGNRLQVVFTCPPRWLGQFGRTSQMTEWKPRFNYFWDWTSRMVQIGIWDDITIDVVDAGELRDVHAYTDVCLETQTGMLCVKGSAVGAAGYTVRCQLMDGAETVYETSQPMADFVAGGIEAQGFPVKLWWPNGLGDQPLYTLVISLVNAQGVTVDTTTRRLGFKHIRWEHCEGAVAEADPWICIVNGRPIFLQGVNWTPIRPNFADLCEEDYHSRLQTYRDMHVNLLRVWGGGFLEKEWLYQWCDELGLLVWQEFPLSSSGLDNYPPDDETSIAELAAVARSYVTRKQHHVSLLMWCGGNELRKTKDDQNTPVTLAHPLMQQFQEIISTMDPLRRFIPSTPCGPRFYASEEYYGKGLHWAVNGPWRAEGKLDDHWTRYWAEDDALLRSETGAPGPSSIELIERYAGECAVMPVALNNPLWRRAPWWVETEQFVEEMGHAPRDIAEYVAWGQERQARAMSIAVHACKSRFPQCAGIIIWMGHDSFPCLSNTSLLDFDGKMKPAAIAVAELYAQETGATLVRP